MQDDWFHSDLNKVFSKLRATKGHHDGGYGLFVAGVDEAKQEIIDLFISLVEQESFLDPATGEQTFYTEQLVKRLRGDNIVG